MKILHLDDHKLIADTFCSILSKEFHTEYYWFRNSEDAFLELEISLLINKPPDCIITDYNHLGINGIEFSRLCKKILKEYSIKCPVIMISMMVADEISERSFTKVLTQIENEPMTKERRFMTSCFIKEFQKGNINILLPKNIDSEKLISTIKDYCK